jgi:hypothetical protein
VAITLPPTFGKHVMNSSARVAGLIIFPNTL